MLPASQFTRCSVEKSTDKGKLFTVYVTKAYRDSTRIGTADLEGQHTYRESTRINRHCKPQHLDRYEWSNSLEKLS
jgi:hypothetical protein